MKQNAQWSLAVENITVTVESHDVAVTDEGRWSDFEIGTSLGELLTSIGAPRPLSILATAILYLDLDHSSSTEDVRRAVRRLLFAAKQLLEVWKSHDDKTFQDKPGRSL